LGAFIFSLGIYTLMRSTRTMLSFCPIIFYQGKSKSYTLGVSASTIYLGVKAPKQIIGRCLECEFILRWLSREWHAALGVGFSAFWCESLAFFL